MKLQPTNDLVHIGGKSAALVAAVFVDFPKDKCIFLQKKSLISYGGSNSAQDGALWGVFFSRGVVATVALWKSAPTIRCDANIITVVSLMPMSPRLVSSQSDSEMSCRARAKTAEPIDIPLRLSETLSLSPFRTVTRLHYLNLDLKHICSAPSMLLNCPVRQRL